MKKANQGDDLAQLDGQIKMLAAILLGDFKRARWLWCIAPIVGLMVGGTFALTYDEWALLLTVSPAVIYIVALILEPYISAKERNAPEVELSPKQLEMLGFFLPKEILDELHSRTLSRGKEIKVKHIIDCHAKLVAERDEVAKQLKLQTASNLLMKYKK